MLDIREAYRATNLAVHRHELMVTRSLEVSGDVALRSVYSDPGFAPKTGKTQAATKAKVIRTRGGKLLTISNNKPHARALEGGARPHKIEAKRGKVLRFRIGGAIYYRRSVNHPGNRAFRTWSKATDKAANDLEMRLERGVADVARRFGR